MANVIVSGATGLLGRAVFNEFSGKHKTLGLGFSRAQPPLMKVDLCDSDALETLFAQQQPDFFIHCAAERNPDNFDHDPQHSLKLNCEVTEHIANCCQRHDCQLIFISTDYVFDGRSAPYLESDTPNPLNLYGESKARSESLLQQKYPQAAVVRIPVLYGEVSTLAESAVTVIAQQLLNGVTHFDHDCLRFPTDTKDIAIALREAIRVLGKDMHGVYHISAQEMLTKLDIARAMCAFMNIDANSLSAAEVDANATPRPIDCALKDTRLAPLGISINAQFNTRIKEIIAPHLSQ